MPENDRLIEPGAGPPPGGFRESASGTGLIVPDAFSREREIWTRDERKVLRRAARLAEQKGCGVVLVCRDPRCKANPVIERVDLPDGSFIMRCGHKDRLCAAGGW